MTWTKAPLGELLTYIGKGIAPAYTEDYNSNTSVMVLGQKCVRDQKVVYAEARFHNEVAKSFKPEKEVLVGDILVNATGVGSAGRVAQVVDIPSRKCITDGHVITLRASNRIDSIYLGYFVKTKQALIEQMAEGSTGQTEMNRTRLQNEILVTFPEDAEDQRAIAEIGLTFDRKIAVNTKLNGYLAA
ncbi:restriction endonuclease subunit S [Paratractidigestivibacter sp.]|uniref:restriction endonuclease subunit S n=1 Tax=Paratractidigestivibacter sp. TaxID=2847316 RepID=UPI002AC9B6FE|nr:restriction endonuclease subunit S [Paratractidigestivibacter sp.]